MKTPSAYATIKAWWIIYSEAPARAPNPSIKAACEKVDADFSQKSMRHRKNLEHRAIPEERPVL
jgi:hypothetical protein